MSPEVWHNLCFEIGYDYAILSQRTSPVRSVGMLRAKRRWG
jgi:hypothetical protein